MPPGLRIGMIVPSLNTIAEDDFRLFCPRDVAYHVHRVRLRKEAGRVTMDSLTRAYLEAVEEAGFLRDMDPAAVAFNCTGASVAHGKDGDARLAARMSEALGVPATNTMVAIKHALAALGSGRILHVCPFADQFSEIERNSLAAAGVEVVKSVGLGFTDAKVAARMEPAQIMDIARAQRVDGIDAVLLSCANVRAFEAVEPLEQALGLPVVTSNQAMLWDTLRLAGWKDKVPGGGRLFTA